MAGERSSEHPLSVPRSEAIDAVVAALPSDAIVREEDDGVGRFAGERTVAIHARDGLRLLLFHGTSGEIQPRDEEGQVEVAFRNGPDGAIARITVEAPPVEGRSSKIGDFISQTISVAALVVAFHWWRDIPLNYALVAGIAVAGGLIWSVVASFMPKPEPPKLDQMVRDALAPLAAESDAEDSDSEDSDSEDSDSRDSEPSPSK